MKAFKHYLFIFCVLLLIVNSASGQKDDSFEFVFYNVENLFDVYNDSLTNDDEFLPEGDKHWTYDRYMTKIDHIARVMVGIGKWELPALIGLCEVENANVLYDLAGHRLLKEADYKVIHKDSPDRRGIDVAVLYRSEVFEPLFSKWIGIGFPWDTNLKTRDILYVKGLVGVTDTLHIYINHWPSRWGGIKASMPKRLHVAGILRHYIDSIQADNQYANILISGDFNDTPEDSSLYYVLGAQDPGSDPPETSLVNLMYPLHQQGEEGSLKYRENWEIYDQIIVSEAMLEQKGLYIRDAKAYIYSPEFLYEKDERYLGTKPFRTYAGPRYLGGFSDHMPVRTSISINKK